MGNSHVACLKEAWNDMALSWPGVEIRFFASPARKLGSLARDGDTLKPTDPAVANHINRTSGGLREIELARFDAFLVHGLELVAPPLPLNLSRAVTRQCLVDMAERSTNLRLCRLIQEQSRRAVYCGHTPMRARETPLEHVAPYPDVHDMLQGLIAPEGLTLLRQPLQTILPPIGTKEEYARGSKKLEFASAERAFHDEGEVIHMNANFGRLFLADFLSGLGVASYPRA